MAPKLSRLLFTTLLLLPLLSSPDAIGQSTPEYEVYAIEYASLPGLALSRFLPGAESSLTVDVSLMVWLIKGPDGRTILVDAGYRPDAPNATNPAVEGYLRPDKAVAKLGISPEEVSDVVLTHLHWDHVDGISMFPNANIWVQREELEYYAARAWQKDGNVTGVEARNILELVRLNTEGRLTLVEGDDLEIFEGVRAYTGPRHSYASQYLGVNTSGGTVILASDCVPLFANLELGVASATTFDPESDLAAYDRMRELASKSEWIIPGHDSAVFERFPSPGKGVARIR